ncbi:hypothetical protein D3C81_808040 [compost metagenome]
MFGRQHLQIGHIHQREMQVAQRQPPRHRDSETATFGEADAVPIATVAAQLHRCTGIADDRTHHIQTNAGIRRWRDAPFHADDIHVRGHLAQHRGGQYREAADARQHVDASRPGLRVVLRNTEHEVRRVGEVQIINAGGNTGFDRAVAVFAVVLERTGGIHHQVRPLGL